MKRTKNKKNIVNKHDTNKKNKIEDSLVPILPLLLMVFLLPFIIRLKPIPLDGDFYKFGTGERVNADFFTYFKQIFIYIITIWALIHTFFFTKKIRFTKAYYFMGAYALLVILSTIFSKYPNIALHGFTERKEGMWIVLCYIALMFSTINLVNTEKQIKAIVYSIGLSGLIISVIAAFQYYGMDIFRTEWGQKIIIARSILETTNGFNIMHGEKYSYSVFYNPNYLGGYLSFYVPLMLAYGLIQKNKIEKLFFFFFATFGLVATMFSKSEAGILGIFVSSTVILIVFITRTLLTDKPTEEYKRILLTKLTPIIIIPMIIIISLSYLPMESNPLEIIREGVITLVKPAEYIPLTKETGPINEIKQIDDNTVLVEVDNESIVISIKGEELYIKDDADNLLIKTGLLEPLVISIPPDKYGGNEINIIPSIDKKGAGISLYYNDVNRFIKLYFVTDGKVIRISDPRYRIIENLEIAPSIGLKGKANLASNRGYIWSRSTPIMFKHPIIGSGQDTFITLFPNFDIFGRQQENQYDASNMWTITDKPHNSYLQIGIQSGMLSLAIILLGLFVLLIKSMKNLVYKRDSMDYLIMSFVVLGFMISSIFNDSVIAISPIIYIIMGINIIGVLKQSHKKVEK